MLHTKEKGLAGREKMDRVFPAPGTGKTLSPSAFGGQKQRTAFARMMAASPELLLLDEPFSALDTHLREKLQMELAGILKSLGKDMVLVTHSRDEAYRLCQDLLILDRGENVCQGNTKEIFEKPVYLEGAQITGCKNFSPVKKIDGSHFLAEDWGVLLHAEQSLDGAGYVGIRAHYFLPAAEEGENVFPVCRARITQSPFEIYVTFYNRKRKAGNRACLVENLKGSLVWGDERAASGFCKDFSLELNAFKDKRRQKYGKSAENAGHLTGKKLLFIQCGNIFCHRKVD